ncbi:MAG: acetate/propionate family kinase [Kiritimatiellae bacterium]|nr:acetate/propionate family kinase [Kiritimatiellia bacterium]
MDTGQVTEFLREHVALFKDFPEERLQELVAGSRTATFEQNEAVIEFGEEGRFLGVMLEGEAEASVSDDSGLRHRMGLLRPGDIFGENALMTGDKTTADVIGLTRCKALFIPQSLFSTVLITHPPAIKYLSRTISNRLRQAVQDGSARELAASAFKHSDDPYGLKLRTETPMKLLVVNCGSSSLKFNLFDTLDSARNARGMVERIGAAGTVLTCRTARGERRLELPPGAHGEAFAAMVDALTAGETAVLQAPGEVTAVGHRVVHGGEQYSHSVVVTDEVEREIEAAAALAPLHNPLNLAGIREARRVFPNAAQVAVFDTAFHQTLPPYAYLYGLPYDYYEKKKIRRYGFHGTSHRYVALKAAEFVKRPFNELEIVSCHLGNGASVCAIDHGRSVDTSMGLTPAAGLIMGTRCGDVDPGVLTYLMRSEAMGPDELDALINRESGLLGLSGVSNDMREIEDAAQRGEHRALLAFKSFCYQIRKYIGAYVAAMGGLDIVVFTGGIGQGGVGVRSLACQGLGYMGIRIDEARNQAAGKADTVCDIAAPDAPVRVLIVPCDEERMIARETIRALNRGYVTRIIRSQTPAPVTIEVSAHHIHLAPEHVEALFGPGHELTKAADLSQPGQYACKETVTLIGPKGRVERVRVLGPPRRETQVEVSMTEQFKLGIHPPIRQSGDLDGTPGLTLEGTDGRRVTIEKGVICALRHIHVPPEEALRLGLRDRDMVRVRVEGARELIFGDVLVRVKPDFRLVMHIDTDEANAANIRTGTLGYIDGIQSGR